MPDTLQVLFDLSTGTLWSKLIRAACGPGRLSLLAGLLQPARDVRFRNIAGTRAFGLQSAVWAEKSERLLEQFADALKQRGPLQHHIFKESSMIDPSSGVRLS